MINRFKSLGTNKEFYWTLLFQLTSLLGGVLLIKLLAVSLSKAEYGFYAIITSMVTFVLMMPFTALLQGVGRYVSIYQKKGQDVIFLNSVFVLILICVALYTFLALFFYTFFSLNIEWSDKFLAVFVFTMSEVFKVMFRTINNANRERKNIAISVFSEFFLKISLIFSVYLLSTINVIDVLHALILANILSVLIMYSKHTKTIASISKKHFKVHVQRIWLFSYPLLIWGTFGWLRDMSNRWYLDYFLDKEHVALFAMMGSLALIAPFALQGVIGSFFMPIIYQKENEEKGFSRKFLNILIPVLTVVFFISFVIVYFFKNFIVTLLTDDKYLSISWMLPWMFLTYSLYVLSMISTYELFAHNQTKKLILSSVLPGIIAFVGGYFLIKNYGIEGALYNYMLTYTSYALLTFLAVHNYRRNNDNS
ncbi:MAG: O-antigen/teichoic acid export membrane protein [Alteromonadaceae bacterium]|jgi:O-antigen/teichoic acid export membrane protein